MTIKTFVMNPLQENTYLLHDNTGEAIIIDPGCYTDPERKAVDDYLQAHNLKLRYVLCTHGHSDHIFSAQYFAQRAGHLFYNVEDKQWFERIVDYSDIMGMPVFHSCTIPSAETSPLQYFNTPGHSKGGVCYYLPEEKAVFTGDTLFYESIGRTDMPGGDYKTILNSIRTQLFTLPPETIVYPGHGEPTTIAHEIANNPYL